MSTYAFSDLHAQYGLWTQIKNFIKPEDTVYCLGDCVDRGDVGLAVLNEVMQTPNITLLRGNHEDFISSIGLEILKYDLDDGRDRYDLLSLWRINGGDDTIKDFNRLSRKEKISLVKQVNNLPTHVEYINTNGDIIYLSHAGRQPDTAEIPDTGFGSIPLNNYLWDRSHLAETKWRGKENEYCVHGHTPIAYMYYYMMENDNIEIPKSRFEIFRYCEGHKINIDLGSFDTHRACLLDLDTFEPIYFKDNI